MSFLSKIFGDPNQRVLKEFQLIVDKINSLERKFEVFTSDELKAMSSEFKERLEQGEEIDQILPEAFAVVREAAKRTLGQRHFNCQLMGGIVLHRGQIAEMKTGEGKTLAATLPVYLNALVGKGVHVVTVNDYLARRDTVWMGQIYHLLGLSVGCLGHEVAYVYDPEYQSNKSEIQNPKSETNSKFKIQNSKFKNGEQNKERDIVAGFKVVESYLRPVSRQEAYGADITYGTNNEFGFDYLRDNMVYDLSQMVQRELSYAIIDEVDSILIDEARTPLIISAPAEEAREMYYQFARLVRRLKENEDYNIDEKMRVATLSEEGIKKMEKFLGGKNIYREGGLELVHYLEQALRAQALFQRDRDYVVKESEVIIVDEFTGRLMYGRRYSEGLHQAIEAKEGVEIKKESRTLATITFQNFFRLYKKLAGMTGTAATAAEEFSKVYNLEVVVIPTNKQMIRQDLPDRVYRTTRGKFEAIVEEIGKRHQEGQPILVGTISIEKNEILSRMLELEGIPHQVLNAKHHEKEGIVIAQAGRLQAVTVATNMAGRGVDIVLGGNPPREEEHRRVIELGGLHVIGTERHEARRIDLQLRGRSGRQGDVGSSQFYTSLEDDLMRIFGGDRVKMLMERLRLPEDIPIENKLVSHSIEAAQKKVEGHNFDLRKHLLEYDDVINKHREVIYKKRREILEEAKSLELSFASHKTASTQSLLKEKILKMIEDEIERVVLFHTASDDEKAWDTEEIYEVAGTIFPISSAARIKMRDLSHQNARDKVEEVQLKTQIIEYLTHLAHQAYEELEKKVGEEAMMREIEKSVLLNSIDSLWIDHLEVIDYLKEGIGLRGYGQRDPLVEYKKEAYRLFIELMEAIQNRAVYTIYKVGSFREATSVLMSSPARRQSGAPAKRLESRPAVHSSFQKTHKIGRNDPCPCGKINPETGKSLKYKRCCYQKFG